MLKYDELWITVPAVESYDSARNLFIPIYPETIIKLKHSLIAVTRWEHKWKTRFLGNDQKTVEQTIDYIRCMTINNVPDGIYNYLSTDAIKEIQEYINDPMSATTFMTFEEDKDKAKKNNSGDKQSAESIYADMIMLQIPIEFEKWHLNALLTLIRVCSEKQAPPKKMDKNEQMAYYEKIRRAKNAAKAKRKH